MKGDGLKQIAVQSALKNADSKLMQDQVSESDNSTKLKNCASFMKIQLPKQGFEFNVSMNLRLAFKARVLATNALSALAHALPGC